MPVYKPPRRGAPAGRVGGGTRGIESDKPIIAALVPEQIGLTLQEQPSLYWYLSKPTEYLIEFTLIDEQSVQPILEKRIGFGVQAGIHVIKLADYGIRLATGKQYKWFIALIPDLNHRSKDTIAGGSIERIRCPESLLTKLAQTNKKEVPLVYAKAGIWYEALSTISELIDAEPGSLNLMKMRAFLLRQVGIEGLKSR